MSQSRHLIRFIDKRVKVMLDDKTVEAVLIHIGLNGCRVRYTDGREGIVASWRIGRLLD